MDQHIRSILAKREAYDKKAVHRAAREKVRHTSRMKAMRLMAGAR